MSGRIVKPGGWLGAAAFFLAGFIVAIPLLRFWQGRGASITPVAQQTNSTHWGIQADFKPPRAIVVNGPDKVAILSFRYNAPDNWLLQTMDSTVSITNLSDRPYSIDYQVFAYDAQNRRVAEADDSVTIGAKEQVLRQLVFSGVFSPAKYASIRLIADIKP